MSGVGEFIIENGVLRKYRGRGGRVTVPAGVRAIGDQAFQDCLGLTEVCLPRGVESIGILAFSGCSSLESVILRAGLRRISAKAFSGCSDLKAVRLPDEVTEIGSAAFADCSALRVLSLSRSLAVIADSAFMSCISLTELRLPDSLTRIGDGAFAICTALREAYLPERLKVLEARIFFNCTSLRRVVLPEGLKTIRASAFSGCRSLAELELPESLESVETMAFSGCGSLTELRLPPRLEKIGEWALRGCRGLADKAGFVVCRGVLMDYFGSPETVFVPEGVTRIGPNALRSGSAPMRLHLPDSLKSAAPTAFSEGSYILFVRRWFPGLSRALEDCRVAALVAEEPASVPPEYRRALRIGRAFAPRETLDTPDAKEDLAWLSRYASSLRREAFELPELRRFLCAEKLIRPGSADAYLEEARARNDPELISLFLSYQSELGMASMEKAREQKRRREDAALEARARRAARDLREGIEGLTFVVALPSGEVGDRTELRRRLKARGARLGTAVTPSADYLVTDPRDEPEMAEKAAELGIPLLSGEEFLALLGPR